MTALSRLRARLGEPMTELELVVLNSNNENAARQLEELYEEVRASGKVRMHAPECDVWISQLRPCTCGLRKSHSG